MNNPHVQFQQKSERLADAFRIFNELSENLAQSYQGLQEQVARLNVQLAAARSERMATLIEKEKLAARLQQILAALPAGVLVVNAQDHIVDCNQQAVNLLGEPLIGLDWQGVSLRSLHPSNSPHEHLLADGRIVAMTVNRLGETDERIILLSDVSELRQLQDALAQQKHLSAMGEMVASLAHQVRTPLATAILYASQLATTQLPLRKYQPFAEKILERLHFLEREVNDMLIFAKQGRLAMQGFSWLELLAKSAERMAQFSGKFELDNRVIDDDMLGNEAALRGALLNLLNNAIEAGATSIKLSAQQSGDHVEILIADNGPGIQPEVLEKLFEPFFTTKISGTGLGLAVVKSVVNAHNGRIDCQSQPDQGCAFHLSLPIVQNPINLSSATQRPNQPKLKEHQHETA